MAMATPGCKEMFSTLVPRTFCGRTPLMRLRGVVTASATVVEPCPYCEAALEVEVRRLLREAIRLGWLPPREDADD